MEKLFNIKFTPKIWIMLSFVVLSLIAILPLDITSDLLIISSFIGLILINYFSKSKWTKVLLSLLFILVISFTVFNLANQEGLEVTYVQENSTAYNSGLRAGANLISINGQAVSTMEDYSKFIEEFQNNYPGEKQKVTIQTDQGEFINLFEKDFANTFNLQKIPSTRIKTGLDLQGGVRALVTAEDKQLTESELNDLISVTQERLNVYGLSDVQITPRTDSSGNRYMSVEIAGSTPDDLENLISQQGKFEAKIGNETVFVGGSEDITFIGTSGQDAYIQCPPNQNYCTFHFTITLSADAAQRQADATGELTINTTSNGRYLSKPLDLYVDGELRNSLNIGADLKGQPATNIQISGSGSGTTPEEKYENTQANMKTLQTILKTGSLPFKLQIEKIDRISPNLGEGFLRTIIIASLLAGLGVFLLVFIRYRKIKISFAMLVVMASEIIIVLGAAAMVGWNIDLAGIAGIIAAIGTGVDDQLVILDESRRSKDESIKKRIKLALFIVFTAYATSVVSLLPLMNAGAGLLAGFAVTTLIGISAGVFITRPAFADIARQIEED